MPLRTFLTRLIWTCVLPLFALAAWLAADHVRDVQATSESAAERLAKNAGAAIDQTLSARIGALQVLAASGLADSDSTWAALYKEALGFRRHFGIDVVFADPAGRMRFHTARPFGEALPPLPNPAGRSAAQLALVSGEPAIGDLFHGPIAGEVLVALAAPGVRDGRVAFLMIAAMPARLFTERLRQFALPAGWAIVLRDSRGESIARSEASAGAGALPAPPTFAVALSSAPWTVALEMPRADQRAPLMRAAAAMVLALIGATLAGVLGGTWAGRRLAASVRALADASAVPARAVEIDEIGAARRQLEQSTRALELREAQLRGIFDSASDAILTADASQTVVMANTAAAHMFGCRVDELVGRALDHFVPERRRASHRAQVQAFGDSGASARGMGGAGVDLAAVRAGGEEFPIEAAISRVEIEGRRLYTVILRDVSERRRAERELQASKAKLEVALASMSDGVYLCDASGRIVDFNEAFAAFTRFARKADFPRSTAGLDGIVEMCSTSGEPAPLDQRPIARALRGETATNVEYLLRRRDTGERWYGSYSFAAIRDAAGAITGAVVTARDISAAKRAQAELQASHADLQRLVAAVDGVQEEERKRIGRELHDDLQQTLAAVLMEAEAVRGALPAGAAALGAGLERIHRLAAAAIVSTRRIVNDLRPQMLEELGLVAALQALAQRFSDQTGIACEVEPDHFASELGAHGSVVDTCLFRVVQEALNNVAKHAGARLVVVGLAIDAGGRRTLTVRDDGRGITPQDRGREGSFGLLGMAERVRAVGGTLDIEGLPGEGTTVRVVVTPMAAWPLG